ncbi:hypothetical protein AVEN_113574-1 [Araneus ventricosus]|uniref:Uncharacterized protein n=1 Tax=Araneus ventricosus TaxID=182803 RepID=A0A4Y2R3W3_ARAVE|nr:hypothetical protein AVEN_113574-1 [Araneus ventricosus]
MAIRIEHLMRCQREGNYFLFRIITDVECDVLNFFAPSDFHLFLALKSALSGRHFRSHEEVRQAVKNVLYSLGTDFYQDGFLKLILRYGKRINVGEQPELQEAVDSLRMSNEASVLLKRLKASTTDDARDIERFYNPGPEVTNNYGMPYDNLILSCSYGPEPCR